MKMRIILAELSKLQLDLVQYGLNKTILSLFGQNKLKINPFVLNETRLG